MLNSDLYLSVLVGHCYEIVKKYPKEIKIVFAVILYGPLWIFVSTINVGFYKKKY